MSSEDGGDRRRDVKDTIRELTDRQSRIRNRDVVAELDHAISRQAVSQHLHEMVANGELRKVGAGRATRYERVVLVARTYSTAGLAEHQVWQELVDEVDVLRDVPETAASTLSYVFTEMLNNAIDHSGSSTVDVRLRTEGRYVVIEVEDSGVGVFAKVVEAIGADSPLEGAQRLTLGKFTTWPERHTGEGIFFSSRAAQVFLIEANGVRWTVDNERDDWAIGEVPDREGTLVRFSVDPERAVRLADLFARFTDEEYRFDTTTTVIKLFEAGTRFVSRSEAKRLAAGLEPFDHVVVDFNGVTDVGQGFVDELFRVWASAHPDKELEPINMSEAVRFMVERGLPRP